MIYGIAVEPANATRDATSDAPVPSCASGFETEALRLPVRLTPKMNEAERTADTN